MIRRFRPTLWPTLISVPALLILLALGTWQMNRLAWKQGLIQAFAERVSAEPLTVPPACAAAGDLEYRRVRLSGQYLNDREMYLAGRTFNGRGGWAVLTPFRTGDGTLVIVDRGWVPLDRKDPKTRPQSLIQGPTTVEGLIRRANLRTYFTPENEPEKNLWFSADVEAMAKLAGLAGTRPYLIEGLRQPIPGGFPVGGEIQVALRNDHLQYAITWYALALALMVIYVLYHLKLDDKPR